MTLLLTSVSYLVMFTGVVLIGLGLRMFDVLSLGIGLALVGLGYMLRKVG